MPKISKLIAVVSSILYLFVSLMTVPSYALAQQSAPASNTSATGTWYNQKMNDWYAKVYDQSISPPSEIFGERYTAAQVQWILYSLFYFPTALLGDKVQTASACMMAGVNIGNVVADVACMTKALDIIKEIYTQLGIGGGTTAEINIPEKNLGEILLNDYQNRPISGIKYVSSAISRFGRVPEANAQGFGFTAVNSLQTYWQGFRDVSYALIVMITIVFSFMIMFRVKLSPQLVISVQSALPKIFTALILATFSYAIAGFVIDLSYVVGGLFASLMKTAGFTSSFNDAFYFILPIDSSSAAMGSFYILGLMVGYTILFFLASVVAIFGTFTSGSILGFLGSFIFVFFTIWVLILSLWYAVKIPWILLKNLISLFVSIVVAPIQIVMGAIVPSIGFGVWFKKIIAETLVFPVTGLFIFLAFKTLNASFAVSFSSISQFFLQNIFGISQGASLELWTPPLLGNVQGMSSILWLAISYSFIAMIPKAVDVTKMLIMGTKFDFGNAIGESINPATKYGGQMVSGQARLGIARVAESSGTMKVEEALKMPTSYVVAETAKGLWRKHVIGENPKA